MPLLEIVAFIVPLVILPFADDNMTVPAVSLFLAEVSIFPTVILPIAEAVDEVKSLPSCVVGTFAGFTSEVKPARKINAGLLVKMGISGSEPERVASGPVILILPAVILPVASTFSATPS